MKTLISRAETADDLVHFRFYYYEPSLPAAIVFVVLFGIATMVHTYQMARSRTWFMVPFIVGGIFETAGYIGRTLSALENPGPYSKWPYIIQSLLLLVAPPLFAASIYMELGRIVLMVNGDKKLFIRRTWLTKIFVIGDVASFLAQGAGSGMLASKHLANINFGNYIIIAGLFTQVAFFGLFVIAASIFHVRMAKAPTPLSLDRPWTKHMIALYLVSALILARSIMRCVEFLQGYGGYVMSHEMFLYGFDAVMMFLAVVTINVIHPGEVAGYVRETNGDDKKGSYSQVDTEYVGA